MVTVRLPTLTAVPEKKGLLRLFLSHPFVPSAPPHTENTVSILNAESVFNVFGLPQQLVTVLS